MVTFATSGTTGIPKSVAFSDEQWAMRIAALVASRPPGFAAIKSWYVDGRENSASFQRYEAYGKANNIAIYGSSPNRASVAATIAFWQENNIQGFSGSPTGLLNYALAKPNYKFDMMAVGGGSLSPANAKMITAVFGPNLWNLYSVSEVGTIAFATAAQIEVVRGCVGKPIAGVTAGIQSGEVCVKTSTMASDIVLDPQGWFHTGDLGSIASDGSIILTGRLGTKK
jgi:long-subunit acyl-CoA synthetase (AMP-forming)